MLSGKWNSFWTAIGAISGVVATVIAILAYVTTPTVTSPIPIGPPAPGPNVVGANAPIEIIDAQAGTEQPFRKSFLIFFPTGTIWNYLFSVRINKTKPESLTKCSGELQTSTQLYFLVRILETNSDGLWKTETEFDLEQGIRTNEVWLGIVHSGEKLNLTNARLRMRCSEYTTVWQSVDTRLFDNRFRRTDAK
jgi:hypothetical protein